MRRSKAAIGAALAGALALAGCGGETGRVGIASAKPAPAPSDSSTKAEAKDQPYPSTYRHYPGTPTALVGATIYDGKGGWIDKGAVLFS